MKTIECELSSESIGRIISEIEDFEKGLGKKCGELVNKLVETGKVEGDSNVPHRYAGYVTFRKDNQEELDGEYSADLVEDSSPMVVSWQTGSSDNAVTHEATISPHLMSEVGSGHYVENPLGVVGVGQGTLNTFGHAFDEQWSYYVDGDKYVVKGEHPTRPLEKARNRMIQEASQYTRMVFGGD